MAAQGLRFCEGFGAEFALESVLYLWLFCFGYLFGLEWVFSFRNLLVWLNLRRLHRRTHDLRGYFLDIEIANFNLNILNCFFGSR